MFNLFSKGHLSALFALLSLTTMNSSLMAWEYCDSYEYDSFECNRTYIGGFGGGIYSNSSRVTQMGVALFTEADGGPLAVQAEGHTKSTSAGFGGAQIGYEWLKSIGCSDWSFGTALEIEAYWYKHTKTGHLFNTTDTGRIPEHDFLDSFKMDTGVYLANVVFSINNSSFLSSLSPYVGLGVGATRISISGASSLQVAPPEAGINHFNSETSDASWAFAAQVKAGLRYNICESFHIFGEYRYLYVDFSNYIFGSTVYTTVPPLHAHTTPWNVKIKDIQYSAFAFGIQYDL